MASAGQICTDDMGRVLMTVDGSAVMYDPTASPCDCGGDPIACVTARVEWHALGESYWETVCANQITNRSINLPNFGPPWSFDGLGINPTCVPVDCPCVPNDVTGPGDWTWTPDLEYTDCFLRPSPQHFRCDNFSSSGFQAPVGFDNRAIVTRFPGDVYRIIGESQILIPHAQVVVDGNGDFFDCPLQCNGPLDESCGTFPGNGTPSTELAKYTGPYIDKFIDFTGMFTPPQNFSCGSFRFEWELAAGFNPATDLQTVTGEGWSKVRRNKISTLRCTVNLPDAHWTLKQTRSDGVDACTYIEHWLWPANGVKTATISRGSMDDGGTQVQARPQVLFQQFAQPYQSQCGFEIAADSYDVELLFGFVEVFGT